MIYESNIVGYFLNMNVHTNYFVINNVYVPFGNCKCYLSIFIKFELLSFEHVYPISHLM